jgi:hypothetical protein
MIVETKLVERVIEKLDAEDKRAIEIMKLTGKRFDQCWRIAQYEDNSGIVREVGK